MSRVVFNNTSTVPSAPAAGKILIFADSISSTLKSKDEGGVVRNLGVLNNYSTTSQSPAGVTRTYLTGSRLQVGTQAPQAGSQFIWKWNMTKTASGAGPSTIELVVGTAGTTADTARLSFTKPAGTASADEGTCEVVAVVRNAGGSAIVSGNFTLIHNLSATGHATIPCVCVNSQSAAFDLTASNLSFGIVISTGTSDSVTIQQVHAQALNV